MKKYKRTFHLPACNRNGGTPGILDVTLGEGFPTPEQCEQAPPLPQWDDFPSVFLPAENKGFS